MRNTEGMPVAGAAVALRNGRTRRFELTDGQGAFTVTGLWAGLYLMDVTAQGYAPTAGRTIEVSAGKTSTVFVVLSKSATSLMTLGHVITHAGEALSTSSAPVQEIDAQALAARGYATVTDLIAQQAMSVAVIYPAGASAAAPAAVALRGPDPTETLIDVDGHALNNGGSGAFDISLLDPAQLTGVQLVYGIAPSALIGPNTIDGAVNVRTIDPVAGSHALYRLSAGAFGARGETVQALGANAESGYVLSWHRSTSAGETNENVVTTDGAAGHVGSAVSATTGLAKLRLNVPNGGTLTFTLRDQSSFRDLSAALSAIASAPDQPQTHVNFAGSSQSAHDAGYGADFQYPLGRHTPSGARLATLVVRHLTSAGDASVFGPAAGINPYLQNERDIINDDMVEIDRVAANAALSLKLDVRSEALTTTLAAGGANEQARIAGGSLPATIAAGVSPGSQAVQLGQTQRSAAIRYTVDASAKLHYGIAAYYSLFSSFGASLDPRFGLTWTPTAQTLVRASIGTTFQSPQLPELYVPPMLPPRDPDGFINIGNPNLTADHATDEGLGIEHIFGGAAPSRISVDAYRTNLRNPAQRFVPALNCNPSGPPPPPQACESFPINLGGAVYQGIESRLERPIGRATAASASYAINSAYPTGLPQGFQGGTLVAGEQFAGVPLQSGLVSVDTRGKALSLDAALRYEGRFNAINRPPYLTIDAGVTWRAGTVSVGLNATNLSGVYADRYTLIGRGVPYAGLGGPIGTDAFSPQGRALMLVITAAY